MKLSGSKCSLKSRLWWHKGVALLLAASLAEQPSVADTSLWKSLGGGIYNWEDPDNWNGGVPLLADSANLRVNLTGNVVINLNGNRSLGALIIGDSTTRFFSTTITGGSDPNSILNLGNVGIVPQLEKTTTGTDTLDVLVNTLSLVQANLNSGILIFNKGLTISGGNDQAFEKLGGGTATIKGPLIIASDSGYIGDPSSSLRVFAGTLNVAGNGNVLSNGVFAGGGITNFGSTIAGTFNTDFTTAIAGLRLQPNIGTNGAPVATTVNIGTTVASGVTASSVINNVSIDIDQISLAGGTLNLRNGNSAGTTTLRFGSSGTLTLAGGTTTFATAAGSAGGTVVLPTNARLVLNNAATLNFSDTTANTDYAFVALNATSSNTVLRSQAGNATLTIGGDSINDVFNGQLNMASSGGNSKLIKVGAETLTLGGTQNNSTSRIEVQTGKLVLAKASSGSTSAVGASLVVGNDSITQLAGSHNSYGSTLAANYNDQIFRNASVTLNGTGQLDLNGFTESFDTLLGTGVVTNTAAATAASLILGDNNFTVGTSAARSFDGTLVDGAGTLGLMKSGSQTLTLNNAGSTYTGATTSTRGTLQLAANGALTGTSEVRVNRNSTFLLNNSATAVGNRVNNSAAIVLDRGTFTLRGNSLAQSVTEVVGGLNLSSYNIVRIDHNSGASSAYAGGALRLTFDSYSRNGGGQVAFVENSNDASAGFQTNPLTSNSQITFINNPASDLVGGGGTGVNSSVLMGAFGGTRNNATNQLVTIVNSGVTFFVKPLVDSDYNTLFATGAGTVSQAINTSNLPTSPVAGPTSTWNDVAGMAVANAQLTVNQHTAFNAFRFSQATNMLILDDKRFILGGMAANANLGTAAFDGSGMLLFSSGTSNLFGGMLDFGSREAILRVSGTASINSMISGSAGLSKSGASALNLRGENSYSGNTWVNEGEVSIFNSKALGEMGSANKVLANVSTSIRLSGGINVGDGTASGSKELYLIGDSSALNSDDRHNSWNGPVLLNPTNEAGNTGLNSYLRATGDSILTLGGEVTTAAANPLLGLYESNPSFSAFGQGQTLILENNVSGNGGSIINLLGKLSDRAGQPAAGTGAVAAEHEKLNLIVRGYTGVGSATNSDFVVNLKDAASINGRLDIRAGSVFVGSDYGTGGRGDFVRGAHIRLNDGTNVDRAGSVGSLFLTTPGTTFRGNDITIGENVGSYSSNSLAVVGGLNRTGTVIFGSDVGVLTMTPLSGTSNRSVESNGAVATNVNTIVLDTTNAINLRVGYGVTGANIAPGTLVTAINGATITLSKNTTAAAADGTSYTFGMLPVSNIQGSSTNPSAVITDTKDVVLASVTNFAVGQGITGPGIPAGTRIDAINTLTKTVTLSNATTAANTDIGSDYYSYNIGNTLTLSNVSGLRVGMGMASGNGIPEGAYITAINGNTLTLSAKITGAIEGNTNVAFPLATVNYRSVSGATNKIVFNSIAGLTPGTIINHANLPNGTTITAIDPLTNTVTVSNPLTASIAAVDVSIQKPSNFAETRLYAAPGGIADFRLRFLDETGFSLNNAVGAISKVGRGTVELSGSTSGGSNIDGGVNLFGGTLVFDYINVQNDLGNDIDLLRDNSRVSQGNVNSPYQLTLGGGSLLFRDGDAAGITENLRGTLTIRAGNSQIIGQAGNSSALLLNLGYHNPYLGGDSRYYWRSPDRFAGGTLQLEYGNLLDPGEANPLGGTVRVQYSQNATIGGYDGSIGTDTILPYATLKFNDPFLGEVVDFSSFNSEQVGAQTNTLFADASGSIRAGNLFDPLAQGNATDLTTWDSALDYSFGGQYLGYISDNYLGQQDPLGANGFQGTLSPNTLTSEFRGLRALRFVSNAANNTVNLGSTRLVMGSAHPSDAFLPGGGAVEDGGAILVSNLVSIDTSLLPGDPTRVKPTDQFITGGQLTSAAGSTYFSESVMPGAYTQDAKPAFTSTDLILHNYNEHGVFTISSQIVNFDARPLNLVVSGTGVTKLAPTTGNTFTGAVFVNDSTLWVANTSSLGQSSSAMLYLNGGVLEFANLTAANRATSPVIQSMVAGRPLVLGGDGGTIKTTAPGSVITFAGVVRSEDNIIPLNLSENQMQANVGVGDLIKAGAGRLILSNGVTLGSAGWNSYYGVTEVNEGALQVNIGNVNSGILGSNASFLDGTLISSGARLDLQITGSEASGTLEWFDLAGGTLGTTASHLDGVLDGVIRVSANSTIEVKQGSLRLNQNSGMLEGAGRLTKTGDGTLMLYENNETFTGEIVVMNGLIQGLSQGVPFGKGAQITLGDNGLLATGTAGLLLQARTASGAPYRATYEIPQNIVVRAEGGPQTQTKILGVVNTGTALVAGGAQNDRYVFGGDITLSDDLILRYTDDAVNTALIPASSTDGLRGGNRTVALTGSLSGSGNILAEQVQIGGTINGADPDQIVTFELGGNNSAAWTGSFSLGNANADTDRRSVLRLTHALGLGASNGVTLDYNSILQVGGLTVNMGNLMVGLPSGSAAGNGVFVENAANQEGTLVVNQTVDETWDVLFRNGVTPTNYNAFDAIVRDNLLNLVKTGSGVATVTQANTYTGFTHVGSANGNAGGTLRLVAGGMISPDSPVTVFGGTFELSGTNHATNQVVTLGGGASGTRSVIKTGTSSLILNNNVAFDGSNGSAGGEITGNVQMGSAPRTFNVGDSIGAAIDLDIKATLLGTSPLVKSGAGTLALSGSNSFSGGVNVAAGTLLAMNGTNGSATGTGDVAVAPGATFGGVGTIAGDVTFSNGVAGPDSGVAILSVGSPSISSGIELLTLQDTLTVGEFAIIDFYLGQTGFSRLDVTNLGFIDPTAKFRINFDVTPDPGASFDLLNWTNDLLLGDRNWIDNLILPSGPSWNTGDFQNFGILKVDGLVFALNIVDEPDSLAVNPGDPATFSVQISGTKPWLLQWMKGAVDIPGATNLSYTIPQAAEGDEGNYSVRVTRDEVSFVTSAVASLVVNDTPQITANPEPLTVVNPGDAVNLTVTANNATSYHWRRDGTTVQNGPSNTLALTSVTEAEQGTYVVEVINAAGSIFSEGALIEVNDPVVIITQPQEWQVPQGTVVTFSVVATGSGTLTYQWFRGATPVGTNSPNLQVTAGDGQWGAYTVRITNIVNTLSNPVISNSVNLVQVGGEVAITTHPSPQLVAVGGTLNLSCLAVGGLPLKYQWRLNGKNISGATGSTLVITNVATSRAGSYSCLVSNVLSTGATSAPSNAVDVGVVNTAAKKLILKKDSKTTLSITASGNVSYQWYRDDGMGEVKLDGQATKSLVLPLLQLSDTANYYCRVKLNDTALTLDGGINEVIVYDKAPDINMPGHFPSTLVSEPYSFRIPLADGDTPGEPDPARTPTKYVATGLPPGLTINSEGWVTGRATAVKYHPKGHPLEGQVAPYLVKITASNLVGAETVTDRELYVYPLPTSLVGVFTGPVARNAILTPPAKGFEGTNFGLGGRIDITTTTKGTYSGKLLLGATTYSFKGALNSSLASPNVATVSVTIARKGLASLVLAFTLNAADDLLTVDIDETDLITGGSVTDGTVAGTAALRGWRSKWDKATQGPTPAAAYANYYTFGLDIPTDKQGTGLHPDIPQGMGYGSFTVNAVTGKLTVSGKLSDGTAYTSATFVGPNGEVLVFRTLYASNARGSILGQLAISLAPQNPENTLSSVTTAPVLPSDPDKRVTWWRPVTPGTTARLYKDGFGPLVLTAAGSRYNAPAPNLLVNANPNSTGASNAEIVFSEANVETSLPGPSFVPVYVNDANKLILPATNSTANQRKATISVNVNTGVMSGKFTLTQDHPFPADPLKPTKITRAVSYYGLVIRDNAGTDGLGYFVVPQLPVNAQENSSKTPILSGQVRFTKLP